MTAQETNTAGAVAVTRLGTQPFLPTEQQVREFMRQRGLEDLGG